MASPPDDLIEMWWAHNAICLYLIKNLPEGGFEAALAGGGFRVGQEFAHMNDVRLRWISGTAPELVSGLVWFEREPEREIEAAGVESALRASGEAIEGLMRKCAAEGIGVNGFPGAVASFLGYMISHDSYHWGEIGATLTQAGKQLDGEVALGIWKGWWGREVAAK